MSLNAEQVTTGLALYMKGAEVLEEWASKFAALIPGTTAKSIVEQVVSAAAEKARNTEFEILQGEAKGLTFPKNKFLESLKGMLESTANFGEKHGHKVSATLTTSDSGEIGISLSSRKATKASTGAGELSPNSRKSGWACHVTGIKQGDESFAKKLASRRFEYVATGDVYTSMAALVRKHEITSHTASEMKRWGFKNMG